MEASSKKTLATDARGAGVGSAAAVNAQHGTVAAAVAGESIPQGYYEIFKSLPAFTFHYCDLRGITFLIVSRKDLEY